MTPLLIPIARLKLLTFKLAAVALLVGTIAVACAPGQTQSGPSATSASNTNFVWVSLFEPSRLNPLIATDVQTIQVMNLIFEGLMMVDEHLQMVPQLAEKYDASADGLTYTFTLRGGLRWQDGQTLTSDDVKFTYDTIRNPQVPGTIPKADYAAIASIATPDPRTVTFTLKSPNAAFLSHLAVGIVPRHVLEGQDLATTPFNRQPVGSGPFVLDSWDSGQQLVFHANPDYYGTKPSIQRFVYKLVKDSSSQTVALLNGEADGGGQVAFGDLPQLSARKDLSLVPTLGANTYIGFQLDHKPFDDARVRQALNYGIDKDAIIKQILHGEGQQSTSDIIPSSWAYDGSVATYPYNPDRAKALLDDAGWVPGSDGIRVKDGVPLKFQVLTNGGDSTRENVLLFVRQQWHDIGVDMEPQFLDLNTFINDRVLKSNFDSIFLAASVYTDPDLTRRFSSAAIDPNVGINFLHYRNADVDQLLARGITTLDQGQRKEIYARVQQIIADDPPWVALYYPRLYYSFRSSMKGESVTAVSPFWAVQNWRP